MAKKIDCPGGELPKYVAALSHIFHPEKLMTKEEYRDFYYGNYPNEGEKNLRRSYKNYKRYYLLKKEFADSLSASDMPRVILENFRAHVDSCSYCKTEYFKMLRNGVTWAIRFGEEKGKVPKEVGKLGLESYFLGLIQREDSKLLELLN